MSDQQLLDAAGGGDLNKVKRLVESGANIEAKDSVSLLLVSSLSLSYSYLS